MNSLLIVADSSCARLFRTAQTNVAEEPVELIEIDKVERASAADSATNDCKRESGDPGACRQCTSADDDGDLLALAAQVADRAARFAHYHFCNPVIVAAPHDVCSAINAHLERALPNAHVRSVVGEVARLPRVELLHDLQQRGAFTAPVYRFET